MNSLRDFSAGYSTQFQQWFVESYNPAVVAAEALIGRLFADFPLGDNEGSSVELDWLGGAPAMREWLGEKRAQRLNNQSWTVDVQDWEATVEVDLRALADARGDLYRMRIQSMAVNAARDPYRRLSDLLRLGATTACYDGQYFFDTDHSEGASGTQSNKLTGTGTSVAQVKTDYFSALAAMMAFLDDQGEPLYLTDFRPVIWIPASGAILEAFTTLRDEEVLAISSGSQSNNTLRGKFDLQPDPRLTDTNDWYMLNPEAQFKPFVRVPREEVHYVDNFGSSTANPAVFDSKIGKAGVEGRIGYDYGMWQAGIKVTNA